jgi:hypothetical protein
LYRVGRFINNVLAILFLKNRNGFIKIKTGKPLVVPEFRK